jgi:tRNA A37 methylthiotransferase MiaB
MRVKFIGNNFYRSSANQADTSRNEYCVVNMAYFLLRHYYQLRGLNSSVEWLPADLICTESLDQQWTRLKREDPDMLLLSVFAWNEHTQHELARRYRAHRPLSVIVMGGPQLTAHKDPEWFHRHPEVNWVVYGDGERALQQIIDYESGLLDSTAGFINSCHLDIDGEYRVYPFEMIQDHEYLSTSPYLNQQRLIRDHIDRLVQSGIPRSQIKLAIEFARGCMYKCSFCDWHQNLSKKVKRRSADWRSELDFIASMGVSIRETDANFGQWPEDLEIFDYANGLIDSNPGFYFLPKNTPKVKQSAIEYIMRESYRIHGDNLVQSVSFQDIDPHVLQLIDRPSLTFQEQIDMVQRLRDHFQDPLEDAIGAQLIVGLPGQTFAGFVNTMVEIWNKAGIKKLGIGVWEHLPNSPGAEPDYVRQHGIKTMPVYWQIHPVDLNSVPFTIRNFNDLHECLRRGEHLNHCFITTNFVDSTNTMTFTDILAVYKFRDQLNYMANMAKTKKFTINDNMRLALMKKAQDSAREIVEQAQPWVDRYGFRIINGYYDDKTEHLLIGNAERNYPYKDFQRIL